MPDRAGWVARAAGHVHVRRTRATTGSTASRWRPPAGRRPTDPVAELPVPPAARADVLDRPVRLVRMRGGRRAERPVVPRSRARRARRAGGARAAVGRARPAVVGRPGLALDPTDVLPPSIPAAAAGCASGTSTCFAGSAGAGGCGRRRRAAGTRPGGRRGRIGRTCWWSGAVGPGCWRRSARPRPARGSSSSRRSRRRRAAAGGRSRTGAARGRSRSLVTAAAAAGVELLTGVTAIGWYDGMVAAIGEDAHFEVRAGAVVAATGSYDRVPLVPGADRPGVMAARTVIGLIDRRRGPAGRTGAAGRRRPGAGDRRRSPAPCRGVRRGRTGPDRVTRVDPGTGG